MQLREFGATFAALTGIFTGPTVTTDGAPSIYDGIERRRDAL